MFRSLWFTLSAAFTALSFLSIVTLGLVTAIVFSYMEFKRYVTPEAIADTTRSQHLIFVEAIANPASDLWLSKAKKEMISDVLNLTTEDRGFYVGYASDPEMYYEVFDREGRLFSRFPETFPDHVRHIFTEQRNAEGREGDVSLWLRGDGLIWVRQTLLDGNGRDSGRIDLLFQAEFGVAELLEQLFRLWAARWYMIIAFFVVVGLTCGMVANRFVTGRLQQMNRVTSIWSGGNLSPRIPVHGKSHDILAEHSRTLNGMADELESLVELRGRTAVAEERSRMARELHDTVKQNLFALKLQLAAALRKNRTPEAVVHIEEAQHITDEAQQDIQSILTQLAPNSEEKGLYGRLAALSDDMRRRYEIQVVWENRESLAVTPEEEQTLLRIAREAMNNSIRHGRAGRIVLNARCLGGFNHLSLADDGCGLPGGRAPFHGSGMGLAFMRKRAKELPDGKLSVANGPSGGVVVEIKWRAR